MTEGPRDEFWREHMEAFWDGWRDEEPARCERCRHLFAARETARPGGGRPGMLAEPVPLCILEPRWPLVVEDAGQEACEGFEPR